MRELDFIRRAGGHEEDIANVLRELAYTGSREEIARVLIEYDWALYNEAGRSNDYLAPVIESLEEYWEDELAEQKEAEA